MGKGERQPTLPDLHSISELQEIAVRDGVTLRPLDVSDGEALLGILDSDKTIRKRVTFAAKIKTVDDYQDQLEIIAADPGLIRYGIRENDQLVGLISLWRDEGFFGQKAEPDGYGFGYFLSPESRGRGLVTSSAAMLMDRVQSSLPVQKFIAFSEDDNPESRAVLARLGFEPTVEVFGEPTHGWSERKYVMTPWSDA